jgi:alpha-beta hydrolase superfamily lysophospholipase
MAIARRGARRVAVATLTIAVLTGCVSHAASPGETSAPTASLRSSPSPLPPQTVRPDGGLIVHFDAADGVHLTGRVFGTGSTTVALAHMGNTANNQDDWRVLVPELVSRGFSVLTWNRRSVCSGDDECSEPIGGYGDAWRDVVGAVAFAKARGARKVIVGGASIGAMSSLWAVLQEELDVAGVIWIAGLVNDQGYSFEAGLVSKLAVPILVISAVDDRGGAGADAVQLAAWCPEPKTLVTIPGRWHGTEVWTVGDDAAREAMANAILDFVVQYGGPA